MAAEAKILTIREGQMVFTVPSNEEGIEEIVSVDDDANSSLPEPINLGGAWAGLIDGDALLDAIEEADRDSPPSPPITTID